MQIIWMMSQFRASLNKVSSLFKIRYSISRRNLNFFLFFSTEIVFSVETVNHISRVTFPEYFTKVKWNPGKPQEILGLVSFSTLQYIYTKVRATSKIATTTTALHSFSLQAKYLPEVSLTGSFSTLRIL